MPKGGSELIEARCADSDEHRAHAWGYRYRCPGTTDDEAVFELARTFYGVHTRLVAVREAGQHRPREIPWDAAPTFIRNEYVAAMQAVYSSLRRSRR